MQRAKWWIELAGLAETQAGMFTAAQAQQLGAQRPQLARLADHGIIERLLHGVYQLSGTPVDQWTHTRAAWLALCPERTTTDRLTRDPDGVISHRSAAHLLGLGDLDADRIEITLDRRHRTRNPDVLIHRGHIGHADWIVHAGLPVTTPSKTVGTLASTGLDTGHLATITRDALLHHEIPTDALIEALAPAAHRYGHTSGTTLLDDLLQQAGAPTSAVTVTTRAAASQLAKSLAGTPQMTELARQVNHSLIQTPAWQQVVRTWAVSNPTQQATRRALAPLRDQLTNSLTPTTSAWRSLTPALSKITVPDVLPALSQAQLAAFKDFQDTMASHLRHIALDAAQPSEPSNDEHPA